eukprot:7655958-Pyramimonas_sp.AAC.1
MPVGLDSDAARTHLPGNHCSRARMQLNQLFLTCRRYGMPCAAVALAGKLDRAIEVVASPA